mgnify:CR=1 FL=1
MDNRNFYFGWERLGTSQPPERVERTLVKLKVMSQRRFEELKAYLVSLWQTDALAGGGFPRIFAR